MTKLTNCKINPNTGDIDVDCYWCESHKMAEINQALIKAHLTIRDDFRKTEQWEEADKIRIFLESLGVEVKDKERTNGTRNH